MFRRLTLLSIALVIGFSATSAHAAIDSYEKKYQDVAKAIATSKDFADRKKRLQGLVDSVKADVARMPASIEEKDLDRAAELFELRSYLDGISIDAVGQKGARCDAQAHHVLVMSNPQALDETQSTPVGQFVIGLIRSTCRE